MNAESLEVDSSRYETVTFLCGNVLRYDHHPASERGGVGTRGLPTWCYEWVTSYNGYYYLGDHMLSNYYGPLESNLAANYVYVNGERIGMFRADDTADVHYYLTDHLGSVTGVVRRDGYLENKYVYRPFGEKLASSHSVPNKYHYTSQELDPEFAVDWYYYGARYYDLELKIFTSVDPRHAKYPGWGPYVYAGNNPMRFSDPDGAYRVDKVRVPYEVNRRGRIVKGGWRYRLNFTTRAERVVEALADAAPGIGSVKALEEGLKGQGNLEWAIVGAGLEALTEIPAIKAPRGLKGFGRLLWFLGFPQAFLHAATSYVDPDWLMEAWNEKYGGAVFLSESEVHRLINELLKEHRRKSRQDADTEGQQEDGKDDYDSEGEKKSPYPIPPGAGPTRARDMR